MELRLKQLAAHLDRTLAPIYVDPRRRAAARDRGRRRDPRRRAARGLRRARGAGRRAGLQVGRVSRRRARTWGCSARASSSICASRPASPASKAPRRSKPTRRRPNPDQILLVTLPKLDRATQASAWFTALADAGVAVAVYPLERDELPAWIAARLARQQQRAAPETLAFLADRCEGNLLAAHQEIEKLGLLLPEGELEAEAVERAVTDVARYDVFQLSEAWLAGDAARALRIIAALEAEGEGIQLLLWQLGEDVHALAVGAGSDRRRHAGRRGGAQCARLGQAPGRDGARRAARAARRDRRRCCAALARLDALAKGIGRGNAWDELRAVALTLAGSPALPLPAPDRR